MADSEVWEEIGKLRDRITEVEKGVIVIDTRQAQIMESLKEGSLRMRFLVTTSIACVAIASSGITAGVVFVLSKLIK